MALETIIILSPINLEEISRVLTIYFTYIALMFKSVTFMFNIKEIIKLKKSLKNVIESGNFDENSDDFIKDVRAARNTYLALFYSGWMA